MQTTYLLGCLLFMIATVSARSLKDTPAVSHDLIRHVNQIPNGGWTAGVNRHFEGMNMAQAKRLCGVLDNGVAPQHIKRTVAENIPATFDARAQWGSECPSVNDIRDQGSCGSCWAFGAAEAMTDRICIANKGASNPPLSAEDLVSCCVLVCGMGCDGGVPLMAWLYYTTSGVVTGGPYDSNVGCYPYQVAACDHHVNGTLQPCGAELPTPSCNQTCADGADWVGDKHFGSTFYGVSANVAAIQTEIMTHGPVEGAFTVFADFLNYKSGVYYYVSGDELGGHAIKILGWGTENGIDYWLVANSWNEDWGDNGFFKIRRGTDECGIESGVVAGLPK
jgi:cathepsin B